MALTAKPSIVPSDSISTRSTRKSERSARNTLPTSKPTDAGISNFSASKSSLRSKSTALTEQNMAAHESRHGHSEGIAPHGSRRPEMLEPESTKTISNTQKTGSVRSAKSIQDEAKSVSIANTRTASKSCSSVPPEKIDRTVTKAAASTYDAAASSKTQEKSIEKASESLPPTSPSSTKHETNDSAYLSYKNRPKTIRVTVDVQRDDQQYVEREFRVRHTHKYPVYADGRVFGVETR